jgi:microcystin-dependent protein
MGNPYVGEVRMFGGNFAPVNWAFCDGTLLAISQFDALYNLIGTTYGGNGTTNFALPDLRGRIPVHQGSGYIAGQLAGEETVTLITGQLPVHNHSLTSVPSGSATSPANAFPGTSTGAGLSDCYIYQTGTAIGAKLANSSIGLTGSSLPHDNMHPFLAISFIISLYGVYPSQT